MSLGLVAYGSSDESEEEGENESEITSSQEEELQSDSQPITTQNLDIRHNKSEPSGTNNFKSGFTLPPPKHETSKSVSGLKLPAPQNDNFDDHISDEESESWKNDSDLVKTTTVGSITREKLLSSLPPPKPSQNWSDDVPEEDDIVEDTILKGANADKDQPKQLKQPIKISIPALADLQDDEEPIAKKVKPTPKISGSGLFSLLPAPKNSTVKEFNRPLVPHVLTKPKPKPPVLNRPVKTVVKPSKNALQLIGNDSGDDSDDDSAVAAPSLGDFFSLNAAEKMDPAQELPVDEISERGFSADDLTSDDLMASTSQLSEQRNSFPPGFHSPHTASSNASYENSVRIEDLAPGVPTVEPNIFFDDDAIRRLAGKRGKQGGITIIDVTSDQVMPNAREWLTKQLTEEQVHHSHRRHGGPTAQQRRKHQITYLAHQAKERELELKNQWSNNRMTRKQTQAKYGF